MKTHLESRHCGLGLHRPVIDDVAGRKLAKYGDIVVFTEDKDLGDSSEEYVKNLIKEYKR